MPIPIEPIRGIQLKEGSYTFPPLGKYQVDILASKEIPRKFDVCQQGIEALNHLYFEAPPEQRERIRIQQSIWENVLERILNIQIFNAHASYTGLDNQTSAIRALLPDDKQYFPIDLALKSDPSNPFKETKRFARELFDIVVAIITLREEKLFQYADFHIYPGREAFTITDTETGERRITIGIHSIKPDDFKTTSSEQLSLQAIKELISQRWDKREFKKVLNATSLYGMFETLRRISQDIPTWKKFLIGSTKVASYLCLIMLVFSLIMFLSGFIPGNHPVLENMKIHIKQANDNTVALQANLVPQKDIGNVAMPIRIILEERTKSDEIYKVIGNFRSKFRLGIDWLDWIYRLNYFRELKISQFKCEPELNLVQIVQAEDDATFRFESLKWGSQRFKIIPDPEKVDLAVTYKNDDDLEQVGINVEIIAQKSKWNLDMKVGDESNVSFKLAASGTKTVGTSPITIDAKPSAEAKRGPKEELKDEDSRLRTYFTVSFTRKGVPIQIHYLDPQGESLVKLAFEKFTDDGQLESRPTLTPEDEEEVSSKKEKDKKAKKDPKTKKRKDEVVEDDEVVVDHFWLKRDNFLAQLALQDSIINKEQCNLAIASWRKRAGKDIAEVLLEDGYINQEQQTNLITKSHDINKQSLTYDTIYDLYFRPNPLPADVNAMKIVVPYDSLPKDEVRGWLHLAVPGIENSFSIPIIFHPKQTIKLKPAELEDIRETVTGVGLPFELQKDVWANLQPLSPHELSDFVFEIREKAGIQRVDGFGALGLGIQLNTDPNTIYFYSPDPTKKDQYKNMEKPIIQPYTIREYSRKANNKIYFLAKRENYNDPDPNKQHFELVKNDDNTQFKILDAVAKTTAQLYIMVLTEKNVEESSLVLKRGTDEIILPIVSKSKEKLQIVQWKPITEQNNTNPILRYTPKDWIDKTAVIGPLGHTRFQAIVFSGEQPDKDVSDEVFIHIGNRDLANILYQTMDGDWFSNLDKSISKVKLLNELPSQITNKKFSPENDKTKEKDYYKAEQKEIGRVNQYLIVPSPQVMTGQEDKSTQIQFFYPTKNLSASIDVAVACKPSEKVDWHISMNEEEKDFQNTKQKLFQIKITNYPRSDYEKLANALLFLSTCATTRLLHSQYHFENQASEEDKKWAETIRWSLESSGFHGLNSPPIVLGELGKRILEQGIQKQDVKEIQSAYQITRETLLLSWSFQSQSLLQQYLGLDPIYQALADGKSLKNKIFELDIKLQPARVAPVLVGEPERFVEVTFSIPYDKLVFDKEAAKIYQFQESYLYGIPKNFDSVPEIKAILQDLYPYPEAFPKQEKMLEAGIYLSNMLYDNILQYSLWEQRLYDFNKAESRFWVPMLGVTTEFADPDGKIDIKEVDKIARQIQNKFRTYFISPINIRRVYWSEITDKVRGDAEKNRDIIGKEEQKPLLNFVERSMMSQLTEKKCWYTDFSFIIDRMMLDQCPFHKWVYIKTYRPSLEGYPGEEAKLNIFRRSGVTVDPYPAQDYGVSILRSGDIDQVLQVQGITLFQDWFDRNTSNFLGEGKIKDRLRVNFYYEEGGEEKLLQRPGIGGPPILDLKVHPASIILFEVSGYHVSPDRFCQIVRKKDFMIDINKGSKLWNWSFTFDTGSVVTPFAYKIRKSDKGAKSYSVHILTWKQDPPPDEKERALEGLDNKYEMEFLYLDSDVQIPGAPNEPFFPYNNLNSICKDYDNNKIFSNRMLDLLERLFKFHDQIPGAVKFKWDKDLTNYYKNEVNKDQMFKYAYLSHHELRVTVPSLFELPKDFKGKTHPELTAPTGRNMAIIWRISPLPNQKTVLRGFPKYILEKKLFPNNESIFSKE